MKNRKPEQEAPESPQRLDQDDALALSEERSPLTSLYTLPGSALLNRLLSMEDPEGYVRDLSCEDVHWLVKKLGADDAIPLLQLASERQWQYLFDIEMWHKDRLDPGAMDQWLERVVQADLRRLTKWLTSEEGQGLCFAYLFERLQVLVKPEDEDLDIPDGFLTLDGVFFLRPLREESRETVLAILQTLAAGDFERFQSLMVNLAGFMPVESEEEMYRLRNVRLAEHGFLPYEEALIAYAPLFPGDLSTGLPVRGLLPEEGPAEETGPAPVLPLQQSGSSGMLPNLLRFADPTLLERLELEFAGLCNQLVVVDRMTSFETEDLVRVSRKAAGYVNIGLERAAAGDATRARSLVERNALLALFRVGFGHVLELHREAERWVGKSWFRRLGLAAGFWGEPWGDTLSGLLARRPLFYAGAAERESFRAFETPAEVTSVRQVLHFLMVLDELLEQLSQRVPWEKRLLEEEWATFHPFLFNPFAGHCLGIQPAITPLTVDQAKAFMGLLAEGRAEPPFPMTSFRNRFLEAMADYAEGFEPKRLETLRAALDESWTDFVEEYGWLRPKDLSVRHARFIWMEPSPSAVPL